MRDCMTCHGSQMLLWAKPPLYVFWWVDSCWDCSARFSWAVLSEIASFLHPHLLYPKLAPCRSIRMIWILQFIGAWLFWIGAPLRAQWMCKLREFSLQRFINSRITGSWKGELPYTSSACLLSSFLAVKFWRYPKSQALLETRHNQRRADWYY